MKNIINDDLNNQKITNDHEIHKDQKNLYLVGVLLIVALGVLIFMIKVLHMNYQLSSFPCIIHELTGLYCPGCGGTRAVIALFQGEILTSFMYHPVVLYAVSIFVLFMITNTIQYISRNKFKTGINYNDKYLYIGLAIMALNFIIKNVMVIVLKIPPA